MRLGQTIGVTRLAARAPAGQLLRGLASAAPQPRHDVSSSYRSAAAFLILTLLSACARRAPAGEFDDCSAADWCPRMVSVPAGQSVSGSPASEPGRFDDKLPALLRSAAKNLAPPPNEPLTIETYRSSAFGFRVARNLDEHVAALP